MKRLRIVLLTAALGCGIAPAALYDVTEQASAHLRPGAQMYIDFGVWTYAYHNPGESPYPTSVEVLVRALAPQDALTATLPGTTAQYYAGWLFWGALESLDGSVSVPLIDPLAGQLGLPDGMLLATRGEFSAGGEGQQEIAVLSAMATMSPELSEALFGANIANYNNAARIHLRNVGAPFDIGLGPDYRVGNAISETGLGGTSGLTGRVMVSNPEPATWVLVVGAVLILILLRPVTRSRN